MFNEIRIDKNVPRPETGFRGAELPNYPRGCDFPWIRMTIGDSFFIPCEEGADLVRLMNRITGSGCGRVGPGCVSARATFEGGKIGVRAWLIDRPGGRIPEKDGTSEQATFDL